MTQLAEEKVAHVKNFARLEKESAANGTPAWLDQRRRAGIARFDLVGFPAANDEDWRHTQLGPIVKTKFALANHEGVAHAADIHSEFTFGRDATTELVFINGRYHAQLSKLGKLARGVRVGSLALALDDEQARIEPFLARVADIESNPFVALNTGFLQDGAYLYLPKNT